jgi:putative transposase
VPAARHNGTDLLSLESEDGGTDSGGAKKLKQLEDENRKLKHVVAELTLDNRALKDVLSKNW